MRRRLIAPAPGCLNGWGGARGPRIIGARDRGGAMSALVTSRREGALLYVALDRPEKRNAIHRELLLALVDAILAAEREPDVRAVVVYGEGPVFSAGVDFGMLAGDVQGERALPFRTLVGDMQAAPARLEALEKTVIGPLHRSGPGLGLAKRLVALGSNVDKHTFLARELLAQSVLVRSEDAREGARALAERRPPRFTGR